MTYDEKRVEAMNCDKIVRRGHAPWLPSADASDLEVLHFHDIPLIGAFRVHGLPVVFACITGAASRTNCWAYLPVDDATLKSLLDSEPGSTEELEERVHEFFVGQMAAFAIATDAKITQWSATDGPIDDLMDASIRFMDNYVRAKSARRQAAQARADVTREVLEPA